MQEVGEHGWFQKGAYKSGELGKEVAGVEVGRVLGFCWGDGIVWHGGFAGWGRGEPSGGYFEMVRSEIGKIEGVAEGEGEGAAILGGVDGRGD